MGDDMDNVVPTLSDDTLPVIGLGGSAGSLKPLQEFFKRIPADTGGVFVVVVHLSPDHESHLAEILQQCTRMPIIQIQENAHVKPNHVYVIAPGKHLSMMNGQITLTDLERSRGRRVVVDLFFRTLADTHGPKSIAVVLSGADADGSIGVKRIKERGGLTIIQDPEEAEHNRMPRSALETGMVDCVLRAEEIPARIAEFLHNGARLQLPSEEIAPSPAAVTEKSEDEAALRNVLTLLRIRTGRDFVAYKRATILRRLTRRMQVNNVDNLTAYHDLLKANHEETGALLQDLLISVTNFFRDSDAFTALQGYIPELFRDKTTGDVVRVWVPACATGEEAYTLAMLLTEHANTLPAPPQLQIFATDIDEEAVAAARAGNYSLAVIADLTDERLLQFFTKQHGQYRVNQSLREIVMFAVHDVLKDPPFSRLDLISCRNVLIYLTREAQNRVFDVFHFSLNADGLLFLGASETAEDASLRFSSLDKKHRVYRRRNMMRTGLPAVTGPLSVPHALHARQRLLDRHILPSLPASPAERSAIHLPESKSILPADLHFKLIERFSPPSIVVDGDSNIIHLSASAGRFLQIAGGTPTSNLLHLAHPMLRVELRAALFRAAQTNTIADAHDIPVDRTGGPHLVNISVHPAPDLEQHYLLVVFQERPAKAVTTAPRAVDTDNVVRSLERELDLTKHQLRGSIEQYGVSIEEMKASNEELQAMNEELRSASEELETSREELQSINEELSTVNAELKIKLDELGRANSDLQDLMGASSIATVFLDRELKIKRYTPSAVPLFNFIPTDIGRPLSDLALQLDFGTIVADAEKVLSDLIPIEREVRDVAGHWFIARVTPYRSRDDRVGGVVLAFVDVTERKIAEDAVRDSEARFRALVSQNAAGICGADLLGRIVFVNSKLSELLGWTEKELVGKMFEDVDPSGNTSFQHVIAEQLKGSRAPYQTERPLLRKDGKTVWANVSVAVIRDEHGKPVSAVAAIVDTSERKTAERELRRNSEELEDRVSVRTGELNAANRALRIQIDERIAAEGARQDMMRLLVTAQEEERGRISRELHDEVGQHLTALMLGLKELHSGKAEKPAELLKSLQTITTTVGKEIHNLATELRPTALDDLGLLRTLTNYFTEWSERTKIPVDFHGANWPPIRLPAHIETTLYRIFCEALNNVLKHARANRVSIILEQRGNQAVAIIEDNGVGLDSEAAASRPHRKALGILGMKERIELVAGELTIESNQGGGTTVFVRIPLPRE